MGTDILLLGERQCGDGGKRQGLTWSERNRCYNRGFPPIGRPRWP